MKSKISIVSHVFEIDAPSPKAISTLLVPTTSDHDEETTLPYFQFFAHSSTHHHYCLLLSVSSVGELIHFLFPHTGHTKDTIIFTPCLYHSAFLTVNDTTKQHNGATHRIATKQNKADTFKSTCTCRT